MFSVVEFKKIGKVKAYKKRCHFFRPRCIMTVVLVSSDGSSLAVPAFSNARPVASHVHHVASVKYPVAEQMVELEAGAVDGPVVTSLGIVEMIAFRCEHSQMLYVAPTHTRAARSRTTALCSSLVVVVFIQSRGHKTK